MLKIKVVLIGPLKSGKTTIANFLADATASSAGEYHPTEGVRILQFESANLVANNSSVKAEVELWDCSGDRSRFETCWPAFQQDAQGVVLIYDPKSNEYIKELETLYSYFVQQVGLSSKNCLIISNLRSPQRSVPVTLGGTFLRVPQTAVNIDENSNKIQADFNSFIGGIVGRMQDTHEEEELRIMGSTTM